MSTTRYIMSISRLCSTIRRTQFLPSTSNLLKHQRLFGTQSSLGYRYLSNYKRLQKYDRRNFSVFNGVQPEAPSPPPSSSNFLSWILGIGLTVVLPLTTNKWGPFLKLKKDIDNTVEIVEEIVEVVEKVAEAVDKVAEDISGELADGGTLKKVVVILENVSEKTAKDARAVEDVINKFQEVEEQVEAIAKTLGYHEPNEIHKAAKNG